MTNRLTVTKTYKLFINGQFPRSESGRSLIVQAKDGSVLAHTCHASRKDLRDAVVAARGAFDGWSRRSAYNRGQILYRLAEMLEGKRSEFAEAIDSTAPSAPEPPAKKKPTSKKSASSAPRPARPDPEREVSAAIDRLVAFAGWADKFSQVLGCNNSVNGPYYNFTVAEPTGVVAVAAPDELPLLGLVSLVAPAVCAGATVVALASEASPLPACIFGEVCATSDVPPGVINLLTGKRDELVPHIANHRDIDAIHAANLPPAAAAALRTGASENIKRVTTRTLTAAEWLDPDTCENPWWIERMVDMKTIWHPASA